MWENHEWTNQSNGLKQWKDENGEIHKQLGFERDVVECFIHGMARSANYYWLMRLYTQSKGTELVLKDVNGNPIVIAEHKQIDGQNVICLITDTSVKSEYTIERFKKIHRQIKIWGKKWASKSTNGFMTATRTYHEITK